MRSLKHECFLWLVVGLFLIWEGCCQPGFSGFHKGVSAVLFLSLGITHGAFDRWLTQQWSYPPSKFVFYGGYIGLMSAMAIFWWLSPTTAFAVFLLVSVYHFGEGEIRPLSDHGQGFQTILTGMLIVGVPILSHPKEVIPVMNQMGVESSLLQFLAHGPTVYLIIIINFLSIWFCPHLTLWVRARLSLTTLVWALMFYHLHPLLAFALYFGLWHSIAHLQALVHVGSTSQTTTSLREALRSGVPHAIVAIVGTTLISIYLSQSTDFSALGGIALICVSILTAPHIFVVEGTRLMRLG